MKASLFPILVLLLSFVATAPASAQYVFTVNSTGDGSDPNLADGICADANGDCTLRAALQNASAIPGSFTIEFDIPGPGPHVIQPISDYHPIWQQVVIDGYSQPQATPATATLPANLKIILDGSNLAPDRDLLNFVGSAPGSAVRGLVFQNYPDAAIHIEGLSAPVTVQGNHIGVDVTGAFAVGGTYGIYTPSDGHLIGGVTPDTRNVISGNTYGLWLLGNHINVVNNYIGTNSVGVFPVPNELGIYAQWSNHIGRAFLGNVISGNVEGLTVTRECTVRGNLIGTDATGTNVVENTDVAINVNYIGNTIGGRLPGQGNVIAGGRDGILIHHGETTILGNHIGTDITGTITDTDGDWYSHEFGFEHAAILVYGPSNVIGGKRLGEGNVIAGSSYGIRLDGVAGYTHSNWIRGNFIGTDRTGTRDLGNTVVGLLTLYSHDNIIGGLSQTAGNTVAFNAHGIQIQGQTAIGNAMLRNSNYQNRGQSIFLSLFTGNDPLDADGGPNETQNTPVLTSATLNGTTIEVIGSLDSTPDTDYWIEFFAVLNCASNGRGEGRFFLGKIRTLTTDGAGHASFTEILDNPGVPVGAVISATATEIPGRNTSTFSQCVTVQ